MLKSSDGPGERRTPRVDLPSRYHDYCHGSHLNERREIDYICERSVIMSVKGGQKQKNHENTSSDECTLAVHRSRILALQYSYSTCQLEVGKQKSVRKSRKVCQYLCSGLLMPPAIVPRTSRSLARSTGEKVAYRSDQMNMKKSSSSLSEEGHLGKQLSFCMSE